MQGRINRTLGCGAVAALVLLCGMTATAQTTLDPAIFSLDGAGDVVTQAGFGAPDAERTPLITRGDATLLKTYTAWNYWELDTGGVADTAGLLHFNVSLYNYDTYSHNFDRFVFSPTDGLIETHLNWAGVGGYGVIADTDGHNNAHRPSGTGNDFAAVDTSDTIHVFRTWAHSTGWEIQHKRLDPQGNMLSDWTTLTTGADCWNWYLTPVALNDGTVMVTWIRDTEDICAIKSTDGGLSWSPIAVLLDRDAAFQAVSLKTVVGADDALHFIWRVLNWTTNEEGLRYAKVRADGTLAVAESAFHVGPSWYPFPSLDAEGHLHVTFATTYDVATDVYYMRLRSDVDLNGGAATAAQLVTVPLTVVASSAAYVHYPVNLVDARGALHVIYEQGNYGCGTTKSLYYVKVAPLRGDTNCNGSIGFEDINPFVTMLVEGPAAYYDLYPGCKWFNGDVNLDGAVNFADINPFVDLLTPTLR